MDVCDIVFCSSNDEARAIIWAAIIGLAGGLLALVGAIVVGLRQSKILEQQTHIQRTQANLAESALDLEHLKVRSDLFDRRFSVYQAVRNWLIWTEENERPPGAKDTLEGHFYEEFQRARDLSRFVFPPHVHREIEAMRVMGNRMAGLVFKMKDDFTDGALVEVHLGLLKEVRAHISSLGRLFGEDMNLTVLQDKVEKAAKGQA